MVPSSRADSSTRDAAADEGGKAAALRVPSGRSVTSTANRSIETRPASGQRLPATITWAAGLLRLANAAAERRIAVGIAGRHDREPGGPLRLKCRAVADRVAALELEAHLHDAALELDHRAHRVRCFPGVGLPP